MTLVLRRLDRARRVLVLLLREDSIELHIQVDQAPLEMLDLDEELLVVGARWEVEKVEKRFDVFVDAALGLCGSFGHLGETVGDGTLTKDVLQKLSDRFLTALQPPLQSWCLLFGRSLRAHESFPI